MDSQRDPPGSNRNLLLTKSDRPTSRLRIVLIGDPGLRSAIAVGSVGEQTPVIDGAETPAAALALLGGDAAVDAVVAMAGPSTTADAFAALASRCALIVVSDSSVEADAIDWLRLGADDVIQRDECTSEASCWRRIRFAIERRRLRGAQQNPHSTDLATGLPHRQQLVEHLSQLLALREREPAPMAVLALRTEPAGSAPASTDSAVAGSHADGLAESRDGAVAGSPDGLAAALRRKAAVRLRAGVRASDIVAAAEDDAFVVLLGAVLSPTEAVHVATKLVASLLEPFAVGGAQVSLAVAVGISHYPEDGRQADKLLRRALALAAVAPPVLPQGPMTARDAFGSMRTAANDDN